MRRERKEKYIGVVSRSRKLGLKKCFGQKIPRRPRLSAKSIGGDRAQLTSVINARSLTCKPFWYIDHSGKHSLHQIFVFMDKWRGAKMRYIRCCDNYHHWLIHNAQAFNAAFNDSSIEFPTDVNFLGIYLYSSPFSYIFLLPFDRHQINLFTDHELRAILEF